MQTNTLPGVVYYGFHFVLWEATLSFSLWSQEAQAMLSGAEMTGLEIASWEGSTQPRSTSF